MALLNVFQVTVIFQGRTRGWTETLAYQGASASHLDVVKPTQELVRARAALLAPPCYVKGWRISLQGSGPDALPDDTVVPAPSIPTSQQTNLDLYSNDPDSALLVRMSITTYSKWKFLFLRGHPDYIFSKNGTYMPDPAWLQKFAAFSAKLNTNPWGWLGVDLAAKISKIPVTGWATDPVTGVTTFTFGDNLFPVGLPATGLVRIRIAGCNDGHSPANNVWVGYPETRTTFKTYRAAAVGIFRTAGIASYTPQTFIKIVNIQDLKYASRKAGAPLLESRGRARNRARG